MNKDKAKAGSASYVYMFSFGLFLKGGFKIGYTAAQGLARTII